MEFVDSVRYSRARKEFTVTKGAGRFVLEERDVEFCRLDALRRSIATLNTLGDSRADAFRQRLLAEFPGENATRS